MFSKRSAAAAAVCLAGWTTMDLTLGYVGLSQAMSRGLSDLSALLLLDRPGELLAVAVASFGAAAFAVAALRLDSLALRPFLAWILVGGAGAASVAILAVGELGAAEFPWAFVLCCAGGAIPLGGVAGGFAAVRFRPSRGVPVP